MKRQQTLGFTLIEVLVAVTILGAAIPALMLLMMQQTDYADLIRDKTIATWVAENKAAELRLTRNLLKHTLQREQSDTVEMAGTQWTVTIDIENTQLGALLQYTVQVGRDPDKPLVTLELYFGTS